MTARQSARGADTNPYVALWSSETWNDIRPDPNVSNVAAVFSSGGRGIGKPVLGKLNEGRQRECMVHRLCQVCRSPLKDGAYSLGDVEYGIHGLDCPVITEPPACARCAALALRHCPGLARERASGTLLLLQVYQTQFLLQMVDPAGELNGNPFADDSPDVRRLRELGAKARSKGGAVGYVKAALLCARTIGENEIAWIAERQSRGAR